MNMLTTIELAERYPVQDVNSQKSWRRILDCWRISGCFKEGEYTYRFGCGRPAAQYHEKAVLRLVWLSDKAFAVAVRVAHTESIRQRLQKEKSLQ